MSRASKQTAFSENPATWHSDTGRWVVDVSHLLTNFMRGLDGIGRIELNVAREILQRGGQAIWTDGKTVYGVGIDLFKSNIQKMSSCSPKLLSELRTEWRQAYFLRSLKSTPYQETRNKIYLLFGTYWYRHRQRIPVLLHQHSDAKIITFVHDLVPIRHPELTYDSKVMQQTFPQYLRTIASVSSAILTNSNFTASELSEYYNRQDIITPPIRVVPLGSDLNDENVGRPKRIPKKLRKKSFALMVSTFEPRKNHQFAADLWRRLAARLPDLEFPLVFAGKRGWLPPSVMRSIRRDAASARWLFLIDSPSDKELVWLYRNAKFTLYPSIMEGWGLPVSESLSLGTYCLSSDNSALREASQEIAWHGKLTDPEHWVDEIQRCHTDPAYLASRTANISKNFLRRSWSDVTRDILTVAATI